MQPVQSVTHTVVHFFLDVVLALVIRSALFPITYSQKLILPPIWQMLQTLSIPPLSFDPWMITASRPHIITNDWNTSVHSTAFIPPYEKKNNNSTNNDDNNNVYNNNNNNENINTE